MTLRQVLNVTWAWLLRQAGEDGAEALLYPPEAAGGPVGASVRAPVVDNREAISVLSGLSKLPRLAGR